MNPLMQAMGGAVFNNPTNLEGFSKALQAMQMLKSGNPEQIAQSLMQQNPQFKAFVEANKGKTPEQVARENGVDLGQIMGHFR